jgi:hypothetical protein
MAASAVILAVVLAGPWISAWQDRGFRLRH